jgi:hypothetical protein
VNTNGARRDVTQEAIAEIRDDFNRLRGNLFGALEAAGMPQRQENAMKGLVRKLTYEAQADLESILRGR